MHERWCSWSLKKVSNIAKESSKATDDVEEENEINEEGRDNNK